MNKHTKTGLGGAPVRAVILCLLAAFCLTVLAPAVSADIRKPWEPPKLPDPTKIDDAQEADGWADVKRAPNGDDSAAVFTSATGYGDLGLFNSDFARTWQVIVMGVKLHIWRTL